MDVLAPTLALCMLASFFLCGIPFGLLIARSSTEHVDVRKVGSGNIGMTNVARSAGGKAAAATLACDAGKGLIAMSVSRLVLAQLAFGGSWEMTSAQGALGWALTLVYASCVLGHVFSPYLHFRGGKGISVGFGAALGLCWPLALGMLAVFLVLALPTRYVSLGSICAALSLPLWGLLLGFAPSAAMPLVLVAAVVVWCHRENVRKLLHGEERRFTVHHRKG